MKQNKYDDPEFFAAYSDLRRSRGGLAEAGEWHVMRRLLPDLAGRRVLDLGCGFGWHCRHARERGAASVVGVDLSARMLERARQMTGDPGITYIRAAIEDLDLPVGSFDVVLSSLAFHYVEHLDRAFAAVSRFLAPEGSFVLSMEHPIFTARAAQDWIYGADGTPAYWPLDDYQMQGVRHATWLAEDVVKYHRTVAGIVNAVLDAGLTLTRLEEPEPPAGMIAARPELRDELRRPMFLLLAARKPANASAG